MPTPSTQLSATVHARIAERLPHLQDLWRHAALAPGPYWWEHIYEMPDGNIHWALCDRQNAQERRVTSSQLILLASLPTYSGDEPATWNTPLDRHPVLQVLAELLSLLSAICDDEAGEETLHGHR